MKRLLAYLFIVLGLGLTFSVNAEAETTVKLVFKGQYVCLEGDTNCGQFSSGPISFHKWKSRKSSFNENGLCMSPEFGTVFYLHTIDSCDHYEKTYSVKYYKLTNLKDNIFRINGYTGKIAIDKFSDPTGQGEGSSVVAKIDDYICIYTDPKFSTDFIVKFVYSGKAFDKKCQKKYYKLKDNIVYKKLISNSKFYKTSNFSSRHEQWKIINKNNFNNLIQTQIAKAEPSQTKKKQKKYCLFRNPDGTTAYRSHKAMTLEVSFKCPIPQAGYGSWEEISFEDFKKYNPKLYKDETKIAKAEPSQTESDNIDTYIKLQMVAKVYDATYFDDSLTSTFFTFADKKRVNLSDKRTIDSFYKEVFRKTIDKCKRLNQTFVDGICTVTAVNLTYLNHEKKNESLINKKGFDLASSFYDLLNNKTTQIAKKEFKPKKTNQDNEAPVIEIAEAITVDSQAYTLKGKVKDKSQVYLTIDGRQVDVKKGKFEVR